MSEKVKIKEVEKVEIVDDDLGRRKSQQQKENFKDSGFMKFLGQHWATIAAILYVIMPLDIIPDFIPVAGGIDDAVILSYQLYQEYKAYKAGKTSKK